MNRAQHILARSTPYIVGEAGPMWTIPQMTGMQTKAFGFNSVWVSFLKDFLYRFLLEKITFAVAETTRETILKVLSRSIEEGWGVDKTVRELNDLNSG